MTQVAGPQAAADPQPMDVTRDPAHLMSLAAGGNRVALARLLSMVEQGGAQSREVARLAYRGPVPYTVGITGAPGSGKSSLTDRLITVAGAGATGTGDAGGTGVADRPAPEGSPHPRPDHPSDEPPDQLAVLAVDPSSPFSGGAILGDRVRMQAHALNPAVFIRSMATRGHLGGLALAVPDAVRVLGAAGMPLVLIETVGVGQMEVEIAAQADTTMVVVTPGWGDSMQANKAGLLEIADLFVINKGDRPGVAEARRDLEQMLDWSPPADWRPPIVVTTATAGEGVEELWAAVQEHRRFLGSERLEARRTARLAQELRRVIQARLAVRAQQLSEAEGFDREVTALVSGDTDPYDAADRLLSANEPT